MPAFFEIGALIESPGREGDPVFVVVEERAHFVVRPDVEATLVTLGIGIEAGIKTTFR